MIWVDDPDIEHVDQSMVYLYRVERKVMKAYAKNFIEKVFKKVDGARSEDAIEEYIRWKEEFGENFLAEDTRQYLEQAEIRRKENERNHKIYLQKYGKQNQGTSASARSHRTTHCYRCLPKQELESGRFWECKHCHWLVCYCGACSSSCGRAEQLIQ
jgi:hypothetical protein